MWRRSSRRAASSPHAQTSTTQAGIVTLHFGQIYVSIGDPDADGAVAARLYWKPLVTFIWLGACVMALGGALSLADRRLRFGAPARAKSAAAAGPPTGRAEAMKGLRALLVVVFALIAASAAAVQPDEVMKDPALEARARTLSAELRCMVCQNQSIDDSDAPLARDIRLLIRDRIAEGESNDAVRAFLVSRYGNFILLKPPLEPSTLLLWLSGPLTLALGALGLYLARRRAPAPPPPLSAEEEKRLAELAGEKASP